VPRKGRSVLSSLGEGGSECEGEERLKVRDLAWLF
jgi:hypothetical protein